MFAIVFALVLGLLGSASAGNLRGATGDIFVFAQSWQPGFCASKTDYVGCSQPKDYWNKYFTIHGLWPQYSAGGYPASCTTEAFNTSVPTAIGWDDMTTYWPNAQYAETDLPNYYSFWEHEWSKHGTCTGLAQYDYFDGTINLLKEFGTPSLITENVGGKINADELRKSYGGATMGALQCNSDGATINGVYTCWSQVNGKVGSRITCPEDVQKEDTCKESSLIVLKL